MNLFVYGTLKDRELIQSLLKHSLGDPSPAIMPECTTVTSKWGYLVMIPDENSSVEGVVWQGLTAEDFVILDRYEGCHVETPVYQREKREVIIEDKAEAVWAYFGTSTFLKQIR
jgi:gamma-glutamylcyclotransferase (GGCT)/AIG2-like uncharacterized protein YtfP